MSEKICVVCREIIEDVSFLELHLVEGVASIVYHEKCYVSSHAHLAEEVVENDS